MRAGWTKLAELPEDELPGYEEGYSPEWPSPSRFSVAGGWPLQIRRRHPAGGVPHLRPDRSALIDFLFCAHQVGALDLRQAAP